MFTTTSIANSLKLKSLSLLPQRFFSYDRREIMKMQEKLRKTYTIMRMFDEKSKFDYEPPNLYYDKETGEIKVK